LIVAYSYVPVLEEAAGEAFAAAMAGRSRAVETFPGFRRFEFRKEVGRRQRFVIATWWDTRADLKRYMASEAHRSTHAKLTQEQRAGLGKPEVSIHEVMEFAT
jgi:heme-degrading monooxygenase HmoA